MVSVRGISPHLPLVGSVSTSLVLTLKAPARGRVQYPHSSKKRHSPSKQAIIQPTKLPTTSIGNKKEKQYITISSHQSNACFTANIKKHKLILTQTNKTNQKLVSQTPYFHMSYYSFLILHNTNFLNSIQLAPSECNTRKQTKKMKTMDICFTSMLKSIEKNRNQ